MDKMDGYEIKVECIPDNLGGGYCAYLPFFGKYSICGDGDTEEEARRDLVEVKKLRFEYYINNGLTIPLPPPPKEK